MFFWIKSRNYKNILMRRQSSTLSALPDITAQVKDEHLQKLGQILDIKRTQWALALGLQSMIPARCVKLCWTGQLVEVLESISVTTDSIKVTCFKKIIGLIDGVFGRATMFWRTRLRSETDTDVLSIWCSVCFRGILLHTFGETFGRTNTSFWSFWKSILMQCVFSRNSTAYIW